MEAVVTENQLQKVKEENISLKSKIETLTKQTDLQITEIQ